MLSQGACEAQVLDNVHNVISCCTVHCLLWTMADVSRLPQLVDDQAKLLWTALTLATDSFSCRDTKDTVQEKVSVIFYFDLIRSNERSLCYM